MPSQREPHDVLGVSADATIEEIHRAFRQELRKYHPDTRPHPGTTDVESDHALQRVLTSYETLRDRPAGPTTPQPRRAHTPPRTHPAPLRATPVRWLPPTTGPVRQRSQVHVQDVESLLRWLLQM
jgi:hypothetical protein